MLNSICSSLLLLPTTPLTVACVYFQAQKKMIIFISLTSIFLFFFAYVSLLDKQSQIDAKLENHKINESIIFGAVFGAFKIKNEIETQTKFHANLP